MSVLHVEVYRVVMQYDFLGGAFFYFYVSLISASEIRNMVIH